MVHRSHFFVFFCAVLLSTFSDYAHSDERRVSFECRWNDGPITIDGDASEAAWKHADLIDDFYLPWLKENTHSAQAKTRARLLWDRQHLYFFAELDDGDLFADINEHDGRTWHNDVFELFFKPAENSPAYYEFQVNAAGTVMDMLIPKRGDGPFEKLVADGQFHIDAKVRRRGTLNERSDRDTDWAVEGRIPWQDFLRAGGRPDPEDTWRFALCRYDYDVKFNEPELSTCAPLASKAMADFHLHEDYAALRFVGANDQTAARPFGIKSYVPLLTSRVIGSPEPPAPYRTRRVMPELKLSWPIFAINEPGTRRLLFIDQQTSYGKARLCRTKDDGEDGSFETLIDFDGVAYSLAFHPRFADNGYLYVGWNSPLAKEKRKSKVTRYTMSRTAPFDLDPKSALTVIEWESDGHNGAAITFGKDGMLYVTSGDGTSDSDTNVKGQGLDHLLSKLLRIDVDHPSGDRPYSVPGDNPFVGQSSVRPETWAYGFRNPWRIATDPRTGHIWVGNNGQDLWEQAFLVERGANYGWSVFEGGHPFYLQRKLGPTPHVLPTVEHPHSEFRSLTGGEVYYGKRHPELVGAYIYGDYSTGKVWGVKVDSQRHIEWHKELVDTALQISAFVLDADGELLIVDHRGNGDGGLYALEVNPLVKAAEASTDFPRTLSETGLFASVREHRMQPSLVPYSVNSPLWSDGAYKERWMALPGDDPRIEVTPTRGWNFPNGTVLVKSFALELQQGQPDSRRWVETRLLTKQDGEWFGYSYRWNKEQTEAELVGKDGVDQEYSIRTADGEQRQTWHYPSRTECMVCHSRAANFVLGTNTLQLNKDHDYGAVTDNQLRVLEHLGLLSINWRDGAIDAMRRDLKGEGKSEKELNEYIERQTKNRGGEEIKRSKMFVADPAENERLIDPYDPKQPLDLRARSYLHANCAHCHVEAGGGNAQIDLEFNVAADKRRLFNVTPVHHTFGISDARLIAPGDPDKSVLLYRVSHRGQGQMPQVATTLADKSAVDMLREWILSLRP